MLKKRLIGVVTVRHGWVVQSFGYRRYLPLGKPETFVENLDRWGADEILIHCIDRSTTQSGPDFNLLTRLGALGLSTPLIYGGGIRNTDDAVKSVNLGADRLTVDALLWDAPQRLEGLSRELGKQALIANLPIRMHSGVPNWLNYRDGRELPLDKTMISELHLEWVSEVMLTDWSHEGLKNGFDDNIPLRFPIPDKPLLVFGGLSEPAQIQNLLSQSNIVAAGIGNFLSYKEHALQLLKQSIVGIPIRKAHFSNEQQRQ